VKGRLTAALLLAPCPVVDNLEAFISMLRKNPSLPKPPTSDLESLLDSPDMVRVFESLLQGPLETAECKDFTTLYGHLLRRAMPPHRVSLGPCTPAYPPLMTDGPLGR
jgi:hypothetical protein